MTSRVSSAVCHSLSNCTLTRVVAVDVIGHSELYGVMSASPSEPPLSSYSSCVYTPTEGFPWEDLCKIFSNCQRMAKVPNGEEILPKISTH